jgi:hypothetical protein
VFHQVAAARLACFRPRAAAAEHRQPHPKDFTGPAGGTRAIAAKADSVAAVGPSPEKLAH